MPTAGNSATSSPLSPKRKSNLFGEIRGAPTVHEQVQRIPEKAKSTHKPDVLVSEDIAELSQRWRATATVSETATRRPKQD